MFPRLVALLASGEASVVKRRLKTALMAYVLLAVTGLFALIFLLMAAYLAAAARWGAIGAAFWFGIGFVVIGVIVFATYRILARAQRRAQQHRRAADRSAIAGASALAMLPTLVGRKGGAAGLLVVVAGVAGYAAYREFGRLIKKRHDR